MSNVKLFNRELSNFVNIRQACKPAAKTKNLSIMAKTKTAYVCENCGQESVKWLGRCPSCGEWNTFTEEIIARESGSVAATVAGPLPAAKPQRVRDIRESEHVRLDLGNAEVNRVLGGGMVPGSLVLVGGEPGIGKSTLSLQIALATNGLKTLYVSADSSPET